MQRNGKGIRLCLMQTTFAKVMLGMACLLFTTYAVYGQGVSGRIRGAVVDPTKAVIDKAAITVVNEDTGVVTRRVTNETGGYLVENLIPGRYRVEAEKSGFSKMISTGNVVTVDNSTVVDFIMKLGAASQSVEVYGGTPVINTTDASMGEVLDERDISSLPLSGGIFSQLVNTVPGSVVGVWDGAWGAGS